MLYTDTYESKLVQVTLKKRLVREVFCFLVALMFIDISSELLNSRPESVDILGAAATLLLLLLVFPLGLLLFTAVVTWPGSRVPSWACRNGRLGTRMLAGFFGRSKVA